MKTQKYNIFILGDKPSKLGSIRRFLLNRFKNKVNIFLYFNTKTFFRMMHSRIDLIILDDLNNKRRKPEQLSEVLKSIRSRFPETQVIINTSNSDVADAVEAISSGESNYRVKPNRSWFKIGILVDRIVTQPIRVLVSEWGVKKVISLFILIFFIMFAVVYLVLNIT
jgi:DNA-binding NtrC family response regulator